MSYLWIVLYQNAIQSHPLCETRFTQYQTSPAVSGGPGDGDCYRFLFRLQQCGGKVAYMYFEFNFLTKENVNFAQAGQDPFIISLGVWFGNETKWNWNRTAVQYHSSKQNSQLWLTLLHFLLLTLLHVLLLTLLHVLLLSPCSLPDSVAAGNSKGFAVANFLVKRIVLVHPTVAADGLRARSLGRWEWERSRNSPEWILFHHTVN